MTESWKKLKKEDMSAFLDELAERGEVFVPQKDERGRWGFGLRSPGEEVFFPPSIIDVSVKGLFFAKRRPIAAFDATKSWSMKPAEIPERTRFIVGLHPCDIDGIQYMDSVFLHSFKKDGLYAAERERTVLIGLTCDEMGVHCHCTDRGRSPDATAGMDVAMTRTEDGFLLKALTEKGENGIASRFLNDTKEVPEVRTWEKGKYPIPSPEELLALYDDEVWDELSDICLTCGACSFACPTCLCFLVSDEKHNGKGERVTVWDSCQFPSYSRMAGGHNDRKAIASRVRNRTLDKFAYSTNRYGTMSCMGCGRCVQVCPLKRSFPQIGARLLGRVRERNTRATRKAATRSSSKGE